MTRRPILPLAAAGLLALACEPTLAMAQDTVKPVRLPHVRPDKGLRPLVDEAARRSPSVRALIDRLESLDVTVYIRTRNFDQTELQGRVALLAARSQHRILIIELACSRPWASQIAALGHELFHATEIAAEPSVVDARSLEALYKRIGYQTGYQPGRQTFETSAAAAAGEQTRRELWSRSSRSPNGTHSRSTDGM